jgi:WD40 repeat protein
MFLPRLLSRRFLRLTLGPSAALALAGAWFTLRQVPQLQPRTLLRAEPTTRYAVVLTPDGQAFVAGRAFVPGVLGDHFTFCDPNKGWVETRWPWPPNASGVVAIAPDASTVAVALTDNTVRVLDRTSGKEVAILDGHGEKIKSIAYAPDRRTIATAGDSGRIRLWDVATSKERAILPPGSKRCMAFSPDGQTLATIGNEPQIGWQPVRLWDVTTGHERGAIAAPVFSDVLTFTPDGRTVALGGSQRDGTDGRIHLLDASTGRELATYNAGPFPMNLSFSPDGTMLAAGDLVGTTVFDLATGETRCQLPGSLLPIFSANSRALYTYIPEPEAVAVWDMPPPRSKRLWFVPWTLVVAAVVLAMAWWYTRPRRMLTEDAELQEP